MYISYVPECLAGTEEPGKADPRRKEFEGRRRESGKCKTCVVDGERGGRKERIRKMSVLESRKRRA